MESKPLVSVIMVFLNPERFIEEAVASVLGQTYDAWELLLVDDGSTDRSTEIARGYAEGSPGRVRYLEHDHHTNRGISASQNLGIGEAKGEFIAFLDADDVWLPRKLEEQVAILKAQPEAAMVYGRTFYWYSWDDEAVNRKPDLVIEPGIAPDSLVRPPTLLTRFLRQQVPIPCTSDVLLRRRAAADVGGFEESFRRIFTDQVFFAKFCLKYPVFVTAESWFKYRQHVNSAVSVVKRQGGMRAARFVYLNWLQDYFDRHQVKDVEVRRALGSARRRCLYPGLSRLVPHLKYRALMARESLRSIARQTLPAAAVRWLRAPRRERRRTVR